ncbi:MAG TPA: competence/damage-inducible protein A [Edaphocola sp.]|nr:competence/damage-inducible protein A [Edaphocola sp.]
MKQNKAIIITIGDELLLGQVVDTNSSWMAQQLDVLGIKTVRRVAVADEIRPLRDELDAAISQAGYVFLTGGLGPTKDDLTKQALAEYFDTPLVQNDEVLHYIEQIFERSGRVLTLANKRQALLPESCLVLPNKIGTASGMWFHKPECHIISLPGVPYEMKAIFINEVIPKIKARQQAFFRGHRHFLLMNVSETVIAQKIAGIETGLPSFARIAYLPGIGALRLRLSGSHSDERYLNSVLDEAAAQIKAILGTLIAATEDLSIAEVVGGILKDKGLTLGLAESCTGGLIASKITDVAGSSAYFNGGIVCYANAVKENILDVSRQTLEHNGAVSEAAVLQMAICARQRLRTDYALAVSGILGPDGGTEENPVGTVWMAIAGSSGTKAKRFHFRFERRHNKELAANTALEWLRQYILIDKASISGFTQL